MKNRKLAELILEFDNSERRLRDQVDRYDKLLLDLDNVNYNSNLNT